MPNSISGLGSSTGTSTSGSTTGLNALSSSDFMKLMITQLEHQDPMNPTDSNQMLAQLSQISNLQSNAQMQTSLSSLTLQQSIGAGGNLIGKSVTGLLSDGTQATGTVSNVQVQNNIVYLGLSSGQIVPMSNVTAISTVAPTPTATTSNNNSDVLSNLLSSLTGS